MYNDLVKYLLYHPYAQIIETSNLNVLNVLIKTQGQIVETPKIK